MTLSSSYRQRDRTLQGRVILVTGASSGIGEAIARSCARKGAQMVLAARRTDRLLSLAAELETPEAGCPPGGRTLVVPTDMRDPEAIRAMAAAALERFGRIDVLVANAGVGYTTPLAAMPDEQIREQVDVNLLGVIHSARAVLPAMVAARRGHILAIASVAASVTMPGAAVYGATKAGVVAFCEGLRREVGPAGIAVTAILPGYIDTPMTAGQKFPMPPARVIGDAVVRLIRRPRRCLVIPSWYAPLIAINRLAPGLVDALVRHRRGRE